VLVNVFNDSSSKKNVEGAEDEGLNHFHSTGVIKMKISVAMAVRPRHQASPHL